MGEHKLIERIDKLVRGLEDFKHELEADQEPPETLVIQYASTIPASQAQFRTCPIRAGHHYTITPMGHGTKALVGVCAGTMPNHWYGAVLFWDHQERLTRVNEIKTHNGLLDIPGDLHGNARAVVHAYPESRHVA